MFDQLPEAGPADHTGSYYAATAAQSTPYEPLQGDVTADVCVIGGGFTGLASALTLAERGYDVVLLEANRIAWGASGRNGGQLIGGMSGAATFKKQLGEEGEKFLRETYYLGNRIVEERVRKHNISCDLKRGWMYVASKPAHNDWLTAEAEAQARNGNEIELMDRAAVSEMLATDAYHGGYIDMQSGHLHPLNLALGEARAAMDMGVRIFEGTRVTGIDHGPKVRVRADRFAVTADLVIMAGGAYHELERSALRGLLFPTGSYIIATEPLGDLACEINPRDLAICDTNLVLDYYRLSADGRMLYGGRCNYSNREPEDIAASIQPRMIEIYPQLEGKRIDFAWGGKIGIIINRVPAIGKIAPNVFYAQGYSGHGVNFSHVAGQILSDAVAGTMEQFDLFARIKHTRIPATQWIGNQILALGMTYYRIRDLL